MKRVLLSAAILCSCAHSAGGQQPSQLQPAALASPSRADVQTICHQLTSQFVAAVEQRKFEDALQLLSVSLQARYSAERLALDYANEPLAAERVQRIKLSLHEPFKVTGGQAELPLPGARSFKLIREPEGWRIAALE